MKKRITAILLFIGCIPLILVSLYYYNFIYNNTMREYNETNLQMVSAVRTDIDNYVERHLAALRLLSKNQQLINLDPAARVYLLEAAKLYPHLSLAVDDNQGNILFRGDNQGLTNIAHRQYFKEAVGGKEAISEVLISVNTKVPVVNLAVPLRNQEIITGVIQGGIELSNLNLFIAERINQHYTAFIIDQSGKVLAHTEPKVASERQDLSKETYVQQGLAGKNGVTINEDAQGHRSFVYYMYDNSTGWLICTQIPYETVMAPIRDLQVKFLVIVVFLVIVLSIIGYFLSNRIVNPIKLVCERASEVAKGNLTIEAIQVISQDEIGELANSFNSMIAHLKQLVEDISHSAEQLAASSEELTASAEQSAHVTNQVAIATIKVAEGTTEQTATVHKTSRIIGHMSSGIQRVATTANVVAGTFERTVAIAQNSGQSVEIVANQMANIEKSVSSTAQVIEKLGERSKEIGQIVVTISEIAGQTNLLALNAAIEAARAGEQGRGFAVVAEEVRKLAEQSQEAATQVASLIGEIQSDTDKAVLKMNDGTREVKVGAEVVNTAGQVLREIVMLVEQVSGQVKEISFAIQQMAIDSQQVVNSVKTVEKLSKNIAGEAQTVSAATEEQAASVEEIASSGQALAKLAEELQSAVQQFKI
jgi:methyl-accepting chemotaxis protein